MRTYSDIPVFRHPTRKGWFCTETSGGIIGWEGGHGPSINRHHIDGPVLVFSDGQMHWLTLWERLQFALGRTDASKLEAKHRPNLLAAYQ
jgi:hypothetical protein